MQVASQSMSFKCINNSKLNSNAFKSSTKFFSKLNKDAHHAMLIMIIKLGSLHITTTAHRLLEQELTKLSKLIQLRLKYYCRILFLKFQPHLLSSSIITPSKCWQLFFTCCNASASDSCDQNLAQYVALKSTCKYELGQFRWKTTSFWLNQMAQHNPRNHHKIRGKKWAQTVKMNSRCNSNEPTNMTETRMPRQAKPLHTCHA